MENHGMKVIHLTGAEKQSGYDKPLKQLSNPQIKSERS